MTLGTHIWDLSWDTLNEGQELPLLMGDPVTLNEIVRYQGASGDLHAAHHDPAAAAAFGMDRPFSLGLLSAGEILTRIGDRLGAETMRHFRSRFRAVVAVGERLGWQGTVKSYEVEDGWRTATFQLVGVLEDGRAAVDLSATFRCTCKERQKATASSHPHDPEARRAT